MKINDIRIPLRLIDKVKKKKLNPLPSSTNIYTTKELTWSKINTDLRNYLSFMIKEAIHVDFLNKCIGPTFSIPIVSKEYSPGRYRYFILPTDPLMTCDIDKSGFLKLTVKKFAYLWSELFKEIITKEIKDFHLEVRLFDKNNRATLEFENGKIYVINVKNKRVFCYTFSKLKLMFLQDLAYKDGIRIPLRGFIE